MVFEPAPPTSTIPEAIRYRANAQGKETAFLWVDDKDNEVKVTFEELHKATLSVARDYCSSGSLEVVDEVVAVLGNVDTIIYQTLVMGLMVANVVVSIENS